MNEWAPLLLVHLVNFYLTGSTLIWTSLCMLTNECMSGFQAFIYFALVTFFSGGCIIISLYFLGNLDKFENFFDWERSLLVSMVQNPRARFMSFANFIVSFWFSIVFFFGSEFEDPAPVWLLVLAFTVNLTILVYAWLGFNSKNKY